MTLPEIQKSIEGLSRSEKFALVQLILNQLAQDEQELSHYLQPNQQHGLWSQHNAFEAAEKLQMLLDGKA